MIGGVGFGQPPGAICQGGPSPAPFPASFLASPPSCCGRSAVQRSREPPCAFLWDFTRPCRLRQGCGRQKGPLCPAQTSQLPGSSPPLPPALALGLGGGGGGPGGPCSFSWSPGFPCWAEDRAAAAGNLSVARQRPVGSLC